MQDYENMAMTKDQELVSVLLDIIIVSANLAKKVNQTIKIKEGGNVNGQIQRTGHGNQRPAQRRSNY